MTVTILTGDCRDVLAGMTAASVDAIVTDPPLARARIDAELGLFARAAE